MRIFAISTTPNFNGLWGKSKNERVSESYFDPSQMLEYGTNHNIVTMPYYPFNDESEEEIKSVIAKNQAYDHYQNDYLDDVSECITEKKVKVMPKLDITIEQYEKYKNDDLLSVEENRVEDILKLNNLKEYLFRNRN